MSKAPRDSFASQIRDGGRSGRSTRPAKRFMWARNVAENEPEQPASGDLSKGAKVPRGRPRSPDPLPTTLAGHVDMNAVNDTLNAQLRAQRRKGAR